MWTNTNNALLREFSIPHSKIEMKRNEGSANNGERGVGHGVSVILFFLHSFFFHFENDFDGVGFGWCGEMHILDIYQPVLTVLNAIRNEFHLNCFYNNCELVECTFTTYDKFLLFKSD